MVKTSQVWKNIVLVMCSVLLMLVLVEVFSVFLEKMHLIDTDLQCDAKDVATTNALIHPYLGYLSSTSDQLAIEEARYQAAPGEVVVGVFGGSVASILATGTWSDTTFEKVLQKYANKKVKVINFAQGGGKQPQQLISLAYNFSIGQKLDYVLLVDGFNEAFFAELNVKNNLPAPFPAATLYAPIIALTSRGGKNQTFVENYENFIFLKKCGKSLCSMEMLQRLASGRVLLKACKAAVEYFVRKYGETDILFSEVDVHDGFVSVPRVENRDALAYGAEVWANGHIAMAKLSQAAGAAFLHYIQPNQYVSGHAFSEPEAKIAFGSDAAYTQIVKDGYREILLAADRLNASGYMVTSLLDIFDAVDEPVYGDSCCHFNKQGEMLLQEHVARDIAKAINASAP